MKISLNWLNQYIDLKEDNLDHLCKLLTRAGLEVETAFDPSKNWQGVVVGKLLEVKSHPNADKLTLCQVDIGEDKPLSIVCGAKNHKEGDFVAVATVGTRLSEDLKIKKSKIRGESSFGMLCSESELGLSAENSPGTTPPSDDQNQRASASKNSPGIMILKDDLTVGQSFASAFPTDIVLDLNVTPNRADCLSHIGLARELSSLLNRPIKKPEVHFKEEGREIGDWIQVEVKDMTACPRYCGRVISGVEVKPSPPWLKQALESIGLNSINNVVDVTNYVLFEYGQPLHAFDYQKIKNSRITVQKARGGESFTTLDETELKLSDQDLMIWDGKKESMGPVALAGVVGGKNSGITESTFDIFLESAFFRPEGIRRTARSYGIETDSCYRFCRGVDPAQTLKAMDRATQLIQETAGGQIQKGVIDIYPQPFEPNEISISVGDISERLGLEVCEDDFEHWMKRLGCEVKKTNCESKEINRNSNTTTSSMENQNERTKKFKITSPSYRWDLGLKEDLIEEYARLKGYDMIPEILPPLADEPAEEDPFFVFSNHLSQTLIGFGLNEAVNQAFMGGDESQKIWTSKKIAANCGLKLSEDLPIGLTNPINEELPFMRDSLLPSLLKNMVFNHHRGNSYGKLFEISPISYEENQKFFEQNRLSLIFWGQNQGLWASKKNHQVVYELKSLMEALLKNLGVRKWNFQTLTGTDCPKGFHPGQSLRLFCRGQVLGIMGSMHPALREENKIRTPVAWAEFNLDELQKSWTLIQKFKKLPKYPPVERDVAFLAKESLESRSISLEIKKSAGPLLTHCEVFDVYQDKELKTSGHKSIAFRLRYQSEEETLSDEKINGTHRQIIQSVCKKLGLEIR